MRSAGDSGERPGTRRCRYIWNNGANEDGEFGTTRHQLRIRLKPRSLLVAFTFLLNIPTAQGVPTMYLHNQDLTVAP